MNKIKDFEFDFEKLDVYKLSLEFLGKLFKIYRTLPNDLKYSLGDQLIRENLINKETYLDIR